ncbi:predicted protein, partial [Nematostella vectensis]
NYWPISTLSSFSQIFEKLVYKQLIDYIEKFNILTECQFGFRKGHSSHSRNSRKFLKSNRQQSLYMWSLPRLC